MAARRIRRFEFPLAGSSGSTATLTVYRQGATSKGSATLPPNSATVDSLPVDGVGALQVGDSITVYRASAAQPGALTVLGVPSLTDVDLAGSVPMSVEKSGGASSDGIVLEIGFVGSPYRHELEVA